MVKAAALACILTLAATRVAAADDEMDDFVGRYLADIAMAGSTGLDTKVSKLGFTDHGLRIDEPFDAPYYADAAFGTTSMVTAWSADHQVAWVASELAETAGGMGGTKPAVIAWSHAAAVFVPAGKSKWHAVAYLVRANVDDKDQPQALKDGATPAAIPPRIEGPAAPVAKQFQATIGDPKAFAKTVSERDDVVLFGSSRKDRVVGGAKVADALARWALKLKVRDGVQAALVGKTVAWVAANVDATPAGAKPGTPPTPYQVFAVYEAAGGAWKLVQLSFAFETGTGAR